MTAPGGITCGRARRDDVNIGNPGLRCLHGDHEQGQPFFLLPALRALNPFYYSVSNEGQTVFADRTDGAEKDGAADDGKTADPDNAVRFEAGRFEIGFVPTDDHIEIFQPLRQLGRDHADEPVVKPAGEFPNNKRRTEFARGQVCLRKFEEDYLAFLDHLKLSLRS
jgi:hypothetical protein